MLPHQDPPEWIHLAQSTLAGAEIETGILLSLVNSPQLPKQDLVPIHTDGNEIRTAQSLVSERTSYSYACTSRR